jgi:predicted transcriptional regulator
MDTPEPILVGVRRELKSRRGIWRTVARDSGVAYHTLTKIAQGRVDPGISKVQRLVDYFRNHPLDESASDGEPSISMPTSA